MRWILAGLAIGTAIALKTYRKWGKCSSETDEAEQGGLQAETTKVEPETPPKSEPAGPQTEEPGPDFQAEAPRATKPDLASLERLTGLTHRQVEALNKAGYPDMAALKKASDKGLLAVSGIGPAALKKIRGI